MLNLLILEDNLAVLSALMTELALLEQKFRNGPQPGQNIAVTVYSTYTDVERIVNSQAANHYDVILLDRDCKLGGSFHALDIEKFGADKVIAISMIPEFNQEAADRGVTRVVEKDYLDLPGFARQVVRHIQEMTL